MFNIAFLGGASEAIDTGILDLSFKASITYTYDKPPVSVIPLPAGGVLLLSGLAALGVARRRRRAA